MDFSKVATASPLAAAADRSTDKTKKVLSVADRTTIRASLGHLFCPYHIRPLKDFQDHWYHLKHHQ